MRQLPLPPEAHRAAPVPGPGRAAAGAAEHSPSSGLRGGAAAGARRQPHPHQRPQGPGPHQVRVRGPPEAVPHDDGRSPAGGAHPARGVHRVRPERGPPQPLLEVRLLPAAQAVRLFTERAAVEAERRDPAAHAGLHLHRHEGAKDGRRQEAAGRDEDAGGRRLHRTAQTVAEGVPSQRLRRHAPVTKRTARPDDIAAGLAPGLLRRG